MQLFNLTGKTAIVTGAGAGLGHGYARSLAEAGANVVCVGRQAEKLCKTVEELKVLGFSGAAVCGDITSRADITRIVAAAADLYGAVDILVNNAGTEIAEDFTHVTEDHFDRIMAVNIKGAYFMAQEAAKYMILQRSGKIINIASLGGFIGLRQSTVYCASKGAVVQFTKALALELAPHGIGVNAIAPGYFKTEMTEAFFADKAHAAWIQDKIPLKKIGTEDDLAGPVIFLASGASDYITGQTIAVDGGWLAG